MTHQPGAADGAVAVTIPFVRPLLDVRDLTIKFPQSRGGAQRNTVAAAVSRVSFSIAPGEVLGLVGESGSGKSITSLAIMGLLPAAAAVSGEISFQCDESAATDLLKLPSDRW